MRKASWMLGLLALFALPVGAEPMGNPEIIEILELQGEIGPGTAVSIADSVRGINENPKVRGVVLVVNSPGGGVAASAAVYEELGKLKVPVVGWCDAVCASGGLYALMAPSVKHIMVRSETVTGSVGVIAQVARYNRLLEWAKVDFETYKSGELKDVGNPTRAAQEPESRYLQAIVDDLAQRFYGVVAKARPAVKDWPTVKSARIFIGQQAIEGGLADSLGSKEDAIKKAKELSGSKLVFTREELKKMSKAAESSTYYRAPAAPEPTVLDDFRWLIGQLKEVRAGQSVSFEYRMPYRF